MNNSLDIFKLYWEEFTPQRVLKRHERIRLGLEKLKKIRRK